MLIKLYKEEEKFRLDNLRYLKNQITSTFENWEFEEEENYFGEINDGVIEGIGLKVIIND